MSRACLASLLAAMLAPCLLPARHAAAQCAQPAGNGQAYNASGPNLDGASSQNMSGTYSAADNITIGASGSITGLCFWGRYSTGVIPAVATEQFRVTFYTDAGGYPSSTVFAGPFTLTQAGAAMSRAIVTNAPNSFVWSATISPAAPVTAGQCLWMEVLGDTPGTALADRWRWSVHNAAAASLYEDGFAYQAPHGAVYAPGNRLPLDFSWALNLAAASAGCQFGAAPNALCSGALARTVPSTLSAVDGTQGGYAQTIPCKTSAVSGPGLWYSVVGNGTTFTAATCGNTNYDTVINVYCGTCTGTDNSGLNCVASNDTGPATCVGPDTSLVSWPTTSGITYLVNVFGYQQAAGSILDLRFSTDSVQAPTNPPCVSDVCPVDLTGIPLGNLEPDACGADTNGADCNAAGNPGIRTVALNQTYAGTVQSAGSTRDRDFWEASGLQPLTTYRLRVSTEVPTVVFALNGACVAGSSIGTTAMTSVLTYCTPLDREWTTDTSGVARILVTAYEFFGLPCSLNRNNYTLLVSAAQSGACCQTFTACTVSSQSACGATGGSVWTSGGACTPIDRCTGVCCTGSACAAASVTGCTGAGLVFMPGVTCSPGPCVASNVCCRGATCSTTFATAASCSGTLIAGQSAGAAYRAGSACNAGAISVAPCCYADYNKANGITTQDLFDFLNDWFGSSPFARTGGDGGAGALAVQNIFDFLSNWFAGGC